jgi:hypothetical protein
MQTVTVVQIPESRWHDFVAVYRAAEAVLGQPSIELERVVQVVVDKAAWEALQKAVERARLLGVPS